MGIRITKIASEGILKVSHCHTSQRQEKIQNSFFQVLTQFDILKLFCVADCDKEGKRGQYKPSNNNKKCFSMILSNFYNKCKTFSFLIYKNLVCILYMIS